MPYVGITQDVQNPKILEEVAAFVEVQRSSHRWVHVHCSTPCSSGSPLKNLTQQVDETEADREWLGIMTSVEPYLIFGDSRSFELPKKKPDMEQTSDQECAGEMWTQLRF